ncbi:MAG: hypothetical protein M1594_02565 [Candidatus Marsarchaeota archaeon]|nr:hypothetical protein [Candidatus Marsarchaeota archaeon]
MKFNDEYKILIKKGISLNKINRITGIAKSTLYHHYKKIKGRKYSLVYFSESNPEVVGEFMGIFAGDGNYYFDRKTYHHTIRIFTGLYEKEYADFLESFLTKLFSKKPRRYANKKSGVIITEFYSRLIYDFIRKYLYWDKLKVKSIRLKNFRSLHRPFLKGFIRGLFDTDGGIYRKKNKVAIGTASKRLAFQIREIFRLFNIEPGFYKYKQKDFWYIDIYGSRTKRFMKIIGTHHPNKLIKRL